MLRILSWSSGVGCDKMHNPDFNLFCSKQQSAPLPEFPLNTSIKRKRSPSCDVQANFSLNAAVKTSPRPVDSVQIQADVEEPVPAAALINQDFPPMTDVSKSILPTSMANQQATDVSIQHTSESRLKRMRQTISAQLSLEILLKHKELRLIDQEMAKCQVALEQLRRCNEIPYPSTQAPSVLVSDGKGPAVRKAGEQFPAKSPAPWGVTDGPYSRHYAKWLLPDARFDGGEPDLIQVQNIMDAAVPARSTRGSFAEVVKTLKPRAIVRSGNFQSLPAGYGQPKEKATGPMILKRKSDGIMVKLVCPDCGRHDFGSAQGFINHCRIGHTRSFASHDAAAEACGEPVEYNNNGTIKGVEPVTTPVTGNTHPLVRSAKLLPHALANTPVSSNVADPKARRDKKPPVTKAAPNFLPSAQTPHLSALMKSQGLNFNLQDLVTDAKIKVESMESDHDDDAMEIDSPIPTNKGRHPQVAGKKQPMKGASKKHTSQSLKSRACHPETPSEHRRVSFERPQLPLSASSLPASFIHPLIPSPTNESTQAPSLVDDDEEFEPQSPPSSDEIDEADIDFDVHDDDHGDRTVLRGGEMPLPQTTCSPAPPARTHVRHPSTSRRSPNSRVTNESINFTSSSPHPEGSDRKRRRIEEP